ncbi:MAG: DNA-processing protein DprA, partial [Firmicutes bacterium]|nr:DNA-processing protein DprA [Bacillota bacterium]
MNAADRQAALAVLLLLKNLPGVGRRTINKYCTEHLKCKFTLFASRREREAEIAEWLRPAGVQPAGRDFEAADAAAGRILDWLAAHPDVTALTVLDAAYPQKLRDLGPDQPPVLYLRRNAPAARGAEDGDGAQEEADCTAVIGSRWPEERTFREGPDLIASLVRETGTVIVSGLARGCDAIGHRAAIAAGGITGAALASGIDMITPAMHTGLAEEILRTGGFLLSEYDPGTEPAEYRYAERDRLTAALADRLLVLECGIHSGTM